MNQTLQKRTRQTSITQDRGPRNFHEEYENKLNRANLPFLASVDSSTSAEAKLYRLLLPHGQVDKLIDLDPYNIQAFYEQNRNDKVKEHFQLPASPVLLSAKHTSPPETRTSGTHHPLRPRVSRAVVHPCQPQAEPSRTISNCPSEQVEASLILHGYQYTVPEVANSSTSPNSVFLHDDQTLGGVITVYGQQEDDAGTDEEIRCLSDIEVGCYLGNAGQQVNSWAADFYSSFDKTEAEKRHVEASSLRPTSIAKDPKVIVSSTSAPAPAMASLAAHLVPVLPKGKRVWTDAEHFAVLQELQLFRADETRRGISRKNWCIGMVFWGRIASALKKYNFALARTPVSVSLYWNRYGRIRSGFDERRVAEPDRMLVSIQKSKLLANK